MEEKNLENLVSKEHLKERGFRQKHKIMYRVIHDQEIRFIEVMPGAYMFDGVYYHTKRTPEEYEQELR
jgi:hypothetical protein